MAADNNDLFSFLASTSNDIAEDYQRIRSSAKEDPGTAGDEGEGTWAKVLEHWLPSNCHVRTKGRIINHQGKSGPQVDVVVLKPGYPKGLLDKKKYLAGGVAAAFECKLTLESAHVKEAVEIAAEYRRLEVVGTGSPFREIYGSFVFGLLAHDHSWKSDPFKVVTNVSLLLDEASNTVAKHPRELIDLVCVPTLATWSVHKIAPAGDRLTTAFLQYHRHRPVQAPDLAPQDLVGSKLPIGMFIQSLLVRLGFDDVQFRQIAEHFLGSGSDAGAGYGREWPASVFSKSALQGLTDIARNRSGRWNEWGPFFP